MPVVKLRLIHTTSVILEVAKEMQPMLRGACFLRMRLIVDVNPVREHLVYSLDEAQSDSIGVSISPGKGTLEMTNTASMNHSIDKSVSTSGGLH